MKFFFVAMSKKVLCNLKIFVTDTTPAAMKKGSVTSHI